MTAAVAELLGAELVPMGSAGAKATSVLLGDSDVYLHGGGQYEWDSAAPVAVCAAAGVHTSAPTVPLSSSNQARPWLPISSSAGPSWPSRCWTPSRPSAASTRDA